MASTGDLIAGRYLISARLGRGGMGTVWRAQDELLGRAVAVKELHVDDGLPSMDAELQRERTLREARSVAQVRHPNIMVLHDIVEHDAQPWIVMELIDGRSLADRIALDGPLSPAEAAGVGLALLDALRAAHASGVQHRDLKPANVLIETRTGRVVLSDFGIAQVAGLTTLTETGSFVGSPEYTAPERMSNRHTGPESDLWSLGVLLCAAVDGESPFHRDSVAGVLHAVVMDDIRIPAAAGPLTPVVRGLLERDVTQRLQLDEAERLLWSVAEHAAAPATAPLAAAGARVGAAPAPAPAPASTPAADPRIAHSVPRQGTSTHRAATRASGPPHTPRDPQSPADHGGAPAGSPAEPLVASTRPAPPQSRRPRVRTAVLAAALAVALAAGGTGFGLWYAGRDQATEPAGQVEEADPTQSADGPKGDRVPDAKPNPTATDRAKPTGSTEKDRPAAGGGAGTDTPADDGDGGSDTPTDDPAPAGYHTVTDPLGFKVAVPDGFTRSYEAPRVYYYSPGKTFRLGFHPQPQDPQGPLAVMRQAHQDGPDDYPGYRDGSVTETTHGGNPAALWKFAWDGTAADGGPRQTYDLGWDEGGKMYDLWISGPTAQQAAAKRHFDVALETFTTSGT